MLNIDALGRFIRVFDGLCVLATTANLLKQYEFHTGINRLMNEPLVRDHCAIINSKRVFYTASALQVATICSLILNVCFFSTATFHLSSIFLQAGFIAGLVYQTSLETSLMPFIRRDDNEFNQYKINPTGAFCGVNSFNEFIIRERSRVTREEIYTV